jgi:hypothetical protein
VTTYNNLHCTSSSIAWDDNHARHSLSCKDSNSNPPTSRKEQGQPEPEEPCPRRTRFGKRQQTARIPCIRIGRTFVQRKRERERERERVSRTRFKTLNSKVVSCATAAKPEPDTHGMTASGIPGSLWRRRGRDWPSPETVGVAPSQPGNHHPSCRRHLTERVSPLPYFAITRRKVQLTR